MEPLQAKVHAVEALVKSGPEGKARVAKAIETLALPQFNEKLSQLGVSQNGWTRPATIGNYREDYLSRTAINLVGIWANNTGEVVYFKTDSDGTGTKSMAARPTRSPFPRMRSQDALPLSKVHYFWSVIAVDTSKYQVIPNEQDRYLLNKQSGVKTNEDGSLTLYFAPTKPRVRRSQTGCPRPRAKTTTSRSDFMVRHGCRRRWVFPAAAGSGPLGEIRS